MVENLVDEYELVGMSAEQIVELLGEPEHKSKNEFRYYLGYDDGIMFQEWRPFDGLSTLGKYGQNNKDMY